MSQRQLTIVAVCLSAVLLLVTSACGRHHRALGRRVVVLGFDGLDFHLTSDLMAQGRLPNFAKLAERGSFSQLGTSIPPQSPVAWSSFITGLDPGGHGIFDFIHRDPKTMTPFLSTSRAVAPSRFVSLGKWQLPLTAGRVELLRKGRAFWDMLEEHGIDTTAVGTPSACNSSRARSATATSEPVARIVARRAPFSASAST